MFEYKITGTDEIIEEKGNAFIALREVTWGNSTKGKLELRKWYTDSDGNDTPNKGVVFLSEETPNLITEKMIELGFGDTESLLRELQKRDDYEIAMYNIENNVKENKPDNVNYFIPSDDLFNY